MKKITDRIAKTSKVDKSQLNEYPAFPKNVKIEITSRCDLKCFYCTRSYKNVKQGDIDRDFLYRMLEELKDLGVRDVGLFWLGESLLVKELPEYIAYAKKIGLEYVFITTNGRLASPSKIRALFDSGLDSIKFSINAGNRKMYTDICGVDALDKVISNVKYAHEYRALKYPRGHKYPGRGKKPFIYASTIFEPDKKSIFDEVNLKIKNYIDEHYPLRLYGKYTFSDDRKGAYKEDITTGRSLKSMLPCWSLFTEPHISYDGYMCACYCDHDERLYMADLKKMSLMDAWHSPKFTALRRKHLRGNVKGTVCQDCVAYKH